MLEEIQRLKKEKNALVLAHYYQREEVQEVADFIGDSLALAQKAKDTTADIIIVCGVSFMAETAKILSPEKVIHPVPAAGCPMADMASYESLKAMKEQYPHAAVVCYVNSTAEVKSLSDVCCTSSNAVEVVKSLSSHQVIFVPDKNLGAYVANQVPSKELILWDGFCYVHALLELETIEAVKKDNPDAVVVAHPECDPVILSHADFIGSTAKILAHISQSEEKNYIVLTESGINYVLNRENPDKNFIFPGEALYCRNMKKITLPDVLKALKGECTAIELDPKIAEEAYRALEAMFNV